MPRPGTDFEIKANCIFAAVQISIKSSDLKMAETKEKSRGPGIPVRFDEINANVVKVHVDGIGRTKENLVMKNLSALFDVKHFEDLVLASQEVRSKLQST